MLTVLTLFPRVLVTADFTLHVASKSGHRTGHAAPPAFLWVAAGIDAPAIFGRLRTDLIDVLFCFVFNQENDLYYIPIGAVWANCC